MSATLGVFDAKARFSELIERAEHGEEITITRRGAPVVKLVPAVQGYDRERAERAAKRMLERRAAIAAQGGYITQDEIAEWKAEGRR